MQMLSDQFLRREGPLGRAFRAQIPALVVLGPSLRRQEQPGVLCECSEQITAIASRPLEYGEAVR